MCDIIVSVPDDLAPILKALSKEEISDIVSQALQEEASERLMFKLANEMLENSEMTEERALELGNELKRHVAERHGLM